MLEEKLEKIANSLERIANCLEGKGQMCLPLEQGQMIVDSKEEKPSLESGADEREALKNELKKFGIDGAKMSNETMKKKLAKLMNIPKEEKIKKEKKEEAIKESQVEDEEDPFAIASGNDENLVSDEDPFKIDEEETKNVEKKAAITVEEIRPLAVQYNKKFGKTGLFTLCQTVNKSAAALTDFSDKELVELHEKLTKALKG